AWAFQTGPPLKAHDLPRLTAALRLARFRLFFGAAPRLSPTELAGGRVTSTRALARCGGAFPLRRGGPSCFGPELPVGLERAMIASDDLDLGPDETTFLDRDHTFHLRVAERRAGAARAWVERVRYRPDRVEVLPGREGSAEICATYRAGTPRFLVRAV